MGKFNELLIKAGVMQDADGLKPSSAGKRVKFSDEGTTAVIDGPFAETKELVAGYWIWNVKSLDDAIEWAKLCPNPMPGEEGVLEIRPTYGAEDFDQAMTDEHRQRDARLRKELARQAQGKTQGKTRGKTKPAKKLALRMKVEKRQPTRARPRK
jgi:hypothetical protein